MKKDGEALRDAQRAATSRMDTSHKQQAVDAAQGPVKSAAPQHSAGWLPWRYQGICVRGTADSPHSQFDKQPVAWRL